MQPFQPVCSDGRAADIAQQLLQVTARQLAHARVGVQRVAMRLGAVPAVRLDVQAYFAELDALRLAGVLARRLVAQHGVAEENCQGGLALRQAVLRFVIAIRHQAHQLPRDPAQGVGKHCFDVILMQWRRGQEGQAFWRLHPRTVGRQDVPVNVQPNRAVKALRHGDGAVSWETTPTAKGVQP